MAKIIETNYGKMTGVDHGTYLEYRSVPYAKPPVGELRFKAPQKPEKWDGIYEATEYACRCVQEDHLAPPYDKDFYDNPDYKRESSEDCLYLNIWTPVDGEGNYPVAFWIHGGAFLGGFATEKEFDGKAYADRGVILVSVEYRCNTFGYLAHQMLSEENPDNISGNYGTLDQIAALTWVYENIAAFGGDPKNITIFGQSAGAMSVQTLISTELTGDMIAKAIMQSGGSYGVGLHNDITLAKQEEYGKVFIDLLGVKNVDELRALPAEKLTEAFGPFFMQIMPIHKSMFLTPTLDGKLLTDNYYKLIDDGKIKDIPYMLGCTLDDIDVPAGPDIKKEPGTKSFLYQGSINFSKKLEELGRKPAYVYHFTRPLPGDAYGAYHSAELFYTFGTLDRCWRPWEEHDYKLSEEMLDCWTNFMKTGNPNGAGAENWAPCTAANEYVKEFN